MPIRIVIASRKSDLARLQAQEVGNLLIKNNPNAEVIYHYRASLGDKNLNDPLWKMPEKGVFTEDFHQGLLQKKFDVVVHSWKDLPTAQRVGTEIFATLPRADVRDVLLIKKTHWPQVMKMKSLGVFTSSPRRMYNLEKFLKNYFPVSLEEIRFLSVRGNIQTRVKKLFEQETINGLVVAKAALDRLFHSHDDEFAETREFLQGALNQCLWMVLPLTENPTAAAQGALAIEVRKIEDASIEDDKTDKIIRENLTSFCDASTYKMVSQEREVLQSHGGGCHQKIGVNCLTREYGKLFFLKGETQKGEVLDEVSLTPLNATPLNTNTSSRPLSKEGGAIFPRLGEGQWYEREKMTSFDLSSLKGNCLWVARADAWPNHLQPDSAKCVWTAGLKTWKKLAQKGIWVNGSAEGLGEQEPERVETFLGKNSPWIKLTHEKAPQIKKKVFPTYRLIEQNITENLSARTHFYWSSGSIFKRALKEFPEICERSHFCGPGNTYFIIKDILGKPPGVFLCVDDFRAAMEDK